MKEISDLKKKMLKKIISTTRLLNYDKIKNLLQEFPDQVVTNSIKEELQALRDRIIRTEDSRLSEIEISPENIETRIDIKVRSCFKQSIRPAINAVGIILHTGLGRAPFSEFAKKALASSVKNYCVLQQDIETGRRGNRYIHIEDLLTHLTGAEAACIVNNNAAAVLLVLNTLAKDREVIISRGQLIEIGGAFRIPDVMERSGAIMIDVGTTNRTHLHDYENAINENTAMIQVCHFSNYRIIGFTSQVPLHKLKELCNRNNLPLVEDIGSGCLIDFTKYGLPPEPIVQDSIKEGADIVTFSGDKILGGPQAGIIVGKKEYVDKIKKNPLTRALRCDKMTFSVLEATLKMFLDEEKLLKGHPVIHMLTLPLKTIQSRARRFIRRIRPKIEDKCKIDLINGETQMGSGSFPAKNIKTKLVAINPENFSADEFAYKLRKSDPPVFTRIAEDNVLFDFRTVHPDEIKTLENVILNIFENSKI